MNEYWLFPAHLSLRGFRRGSKYGIKRCNVLFVMIFLLKYELKSIHVNISTGENDCDI